MSRPRATRLTVCLALSSALLGAGCASNASKIPADMLEPETAQLASHTDAQGEPFYLDYPIGDLGLAHAFDDGSHTFVEFRQPVPSELSCFDQQGALLGCEAVGQVLAVHGVHSGILLRHGEAAVFIAPNPKARASGLRQLGHTPEWTAHVQARNRLLLKAPLREALSRSAGVAADPDINQAAGLRSSLRQSAAGRPEAAASRADRAESRTGPESRKRLKDRQPDSAGTRTSDGPGTRAQATPRTGTRQETDLRGKAGLGAHPGQPTGAAARKAETALLTGWTTLPFGRNSAQLDPAHPSLSALRDKALQADEIHIEVRGADAASAIPAAASAGKLSASAPSGASPGAPATRAQAVQAAIGQRQGGAPGSATQPLLAQARLQAIQQWLHAQGVAHARIHLVSSDSAGKAKTESRRGAPKPSADPAAAASPVAARSTPQAAGGLNDHASSQHMPVRILLLRNGQVLAI